MNNELSEIKNLLIKAKEYKKQGKYYLKQKRTKQNKSIGLSLTNKSITLFSQAMLKYEEITGERLDFKELEGVFGLN